MKLLLIAIESTNENGIGSHISINPGNYVKVEAGTRGFFIAGSNDEIKRAFHYCEYCHKEVTDLNKIKKCKCLTSKYFNLFVSYEIKKLRIDIEI